MLPRDLNPFKFQTHRLCMGQVAYPGANHLPTREGNRRIFMDVDERAHIC